MDDVSFYYLCPEEYDILYYSWLYNRLGSAGVHSSKNYIWRVTKDAITRGMKQNHSTRAGRGEVSACISGAPFHPTLWSLLMSPCRPLLHFEDVPAEGSTWPGHLLCGSLLCLGLSLDNYNRRVCHTLSSSLELGLMMQISIQAHGVNADLIPGHVSDIS